MENFVFQNHTKIIFGKGVEGKTAPETAAISKNILLHYGGGSIKKSGLYDRITASLKAGGIRYTELGGVKSNPRLSLVREGIEICRNSNIDFILAVGGGSVIDSAKAIGVGVCFEGDLWDCFEGKERADKSLPVGVVLTIPAAGSEASMASVITNEDDSSKRVIGYDFIRPVFAIMNPELTYTLPPYQSACGAVDMLAHVMERYFTTVKNVDLTDKLCEAAMRSIIKNAPVILVDPDDYNARAEIMWAGTIAHNDLLGMGRIEDWASHNIEHELSALYDVSHGAGLAVIFPAWMKYVYKELPGKIIQFAVNVLDVEYNGADPLKTGEEGIRRLEAFFSSLGLPVRMDGLEIDNSRFDEMSQRAASGGIIGSYKKLNSQDIKRIYELAR